MPKIMIISVGSTIEPIIFSLENQKPEYIIFFTSKETKEKVQEIINKLNYKVKCTHPIISDSSEDLNICFKTIQQEIPKIIKKWDLSLDDVIVDYTGGTKTMSAALVLGTIEFCKNYYYIGGTERDKNGVGVVISGKERMLYINNPWDEIGYLEKKKINNLSNTLRFSSALEELDKIIAKISENNKPFFEMVKEIITGYNLWDNFQHKPAKNLLFKGIKKLELIASEKENFKNLKNQISNNLEFLSNLLEPEKKERLLIYDLIASAKRRGDIEKKFDDAVARLYRAIEKIAQVELKEKYGIVTSNVDLKKLPENLKEEYEIKYSDEKTKKIKIPLYASYRVLREKKNEIGIKFFNREKEINEILDLRNNSILAHGDIPISEESYKKILPLIFEFSGIKEENIPQFPLFDF